MHTGGTMANTCATCGRLPWWLSSKESACSPRDTGDTGLTPGLGRSPEERNGNPLQCSCLENLMDRGAWWATVHGVAEPDATEATEHACMQLVQLKQEDSPYHRAGAGMKAKVLVTQSCPAE